MTLRVISFNVRYATENPVPEEQPWQVRCPKLCTQLHFITSAQPSAFICLQEILHTQLKDIQSRLGDSWAYIGLGRDDGRAAGEFSPIFYPTRTWRCERNKTYWLSETPDKPSKGWDAVLNRIVTVGEFRNRQTGNIVIVMSTHFDHIGVEARKESAKLLVQLANQWSHGEDGKSNLPVLLCGDFNSTSEDPGYMEMTAPGSNMADVRELVPEEKRYGNENTYSSFGEPAESPKRIDFIFVRDLSPMKILTYGVLSNRFDDMVYLSDHRPVVADIEILLRTSNDL